MDSSPEFFGPILENRFGERYFSAITGEVFSQVGSDSFYQRHFGASLEAGDTLYIIIGTDGGLLLNWLLRKKPVADSRYLFIELPACLERLHREGIISDDLPDNVYLQGYDQWFEKARELSIQDYFYVSRISQISSLSVVDGYHNDYVELGNRFEEDIGKFQIRMSQEIGSQIFTTKGLENLAENRIPIAVIDGSFAGKTAILMAGGPSLDESFAWIRDHRQDLVVLAVTRIAAQLKREEIVPDFLFAIDPHEIIFHQSKEMLNFFERTYLVNMYHLNPRLVGQWRGESLYMGPCFPWVTESNPPSRAFPGITVSHQALGAALAMGFSRIILSGFDLCFSKEGFTHARGSEETLAGPYAKRSQLWITTNGGWMAETSRDFYSSIPALSHLACQEEEPQKRNCQVINPSQASAKIDGVEHLPWQELSVEPLQQSAWEMIKQLLSKADLPDRLQHYQSVEKELNTLRGKLLKIKKLSEEAIACNDKLFGRKGHPPDFKYKKRMDEIEASLDNDFGEASRLVKKWSVGDLLKLSRPNKDKAWSDAEVEETGRRYYEIYRQSSRDFLKIIDDSRQRLRSRQEEEKPRPNLKTLVTQWNKDNQPGRLLGFLDRSGRSLEGFPEKQANSLSSLLHEFQEQMAATETDYKAHCQNILASPMAILGKAKSFFSNDELDKLQNFLDGIRESNLSQRESFVHLMEGYLAQKAGQFDQALACYTQVDYDLLNSERLKQMLAVYLGKSDLIGALQIAKQLADEFMIMIPYYADLLRMTGDPDQAVVMYKQYLDMVAGDVVTEQKLGKLYGEMGNLAAAQEVFNRILQIDPDNKAAHHYLEQYAS
jgi:tetratricopeptide (TPR) repeat protein